MKKLKLITLSVCLLLAGNSYAQFEKFLKGGADDANLLLNNYMSPVLKGMGYGFNNGWYNTAKPHKSLGFDITFAFNLAVVPDADKSFTFNPADYNITNVQSGPTALPTVTGDNSTSVLENIINNQDLDPNLPPGTTVLGTYNAPDGIGDDLSSYGLKKVAIPAPIIQAGIGIYKGTEIKIRWMPSINTSDVRFKYFGVGGLHSISQWLPVFKDIPVDISAFMGFTKISAAFAINSGNIAGANQEATFDVNTLTYQLLVSAHVAVLTGYVGLGMDNFKSTFKMLGTYDVYPGQPLIPSITDPINLEQKGDGGFRTTMGARLKLAIITFHVDYTFREYNTLSFGLGFSFR